jgi:methyl-accepting chemotaxis protein
MARRPARACTGYGPISSAVVIGVSSLYRRVILNQADRSNVTRVPPDRQLTHHTDRVDPADGVRPKLNPLTTCTVAAAITFGLVRPVHRLLAGTAAVEGGALDTVIPITSRDEIGRLTQSFNSMVG